MHIEIKIHSKIENTVGFEYWVRVIYCRKIRNVHLHAQSGQEGFSCGRRCLREKNSKIRTPRLCFPLMHDLVIWATKCLSNSENRVLRKRDRNSPANPCSPLCARPHENLNSFGFLWVPLGSADSSSFALGSCKLIVDIGNRVRGSAK